MTDARPQVALIGIGTMGHGIADSLLRAGFTPTLWNREPEALAPFAGTAAVTAEKVVDAVHEADIVITMVTDAHAVIAVADEQGMLDALPPGAIWIQMSTIGVDGIRRASALVAERRPDVTFVDAPVTGSRPAAEAGALTILASGPDSARDRVMPVFDALGERTLWLGPAGLGTALKLANNTMIAFTVQGLGEALAVAKHLGLTTATVAEAFGATAFASPYLTSKLERMEHGVYDAEFALALALKDVKLALDTVEPARHPVLDALAAQWQQANDRGLGSQDLTAVAQILVEPA